MTDVIGVHRVRAGFEAVCSLLKQTCPSLAFKALTYSLQANPHIEFERVLESFDDTNVNHIVPQPSDLGLAMRLLEPIKKAMTLHLQPAIDAEVYTLNGFIE